jgi:predicted GTPase
VSLSNCLINSYCIVIFHWFSSLGRAWDQIKEETNKMADLHQNLSQQLRAAVYSPIETFAKEQSKQRKQLIQEMKNAMREYTHLDAIITRVLSR